MKKVLRFLTLALILALALSLAAPAWAAKKDFKITWLSGIEAPDHSVYEAAYLKDQNAVTISFNPDKSNHHYMFDVETGQPIESKYDIIYDYSEGLARVWKKGRGYGYIDAEGREVVGCKFSQAYDFSDGVARVHIGDDDALIDSSGSVLCKYGAIDSFHEGLASVNNGQINANFASGYIDTTGRTVIPLKYNGFCGDFSEGLADVPIRQGDKLKYGYIDTTGAVVVPFEYDEAHSFHEGFAIIAKEDENGNKKFGFIDKTGAVVVSPRYDAVSDFSDGFAAVRNNAGWGYINTAGNLVVSPQYSTATPFTEGYAVVVNRSSHIDETAAVIDAATGKTVRSVKCTSVHGFSGGLARVEYNFNGLNTGFINTRGRTVVPFKYNSASDFLTGLACVERNGKYGFVNAKGKEVVPVEYDAAGFVGHRFNAHGEFYKKTYGDVTSAQYCWVVKGSQIGIFKNPYYADGIVSIEVGKGAAIDLSIICILVIPIGLIIWLFILRPRKKQKAATRNAAQTPDGLSVQTETPTPETAAVPKGVPAPAPQTTPREEEITPPPEELAKKRFCPYCGKPVPVDYQFCPKCGKQLPSAED